MIRLENVEKSYHRGTTLVRALRGRQAADETHLIHLLGDLR